MELNFVLAGPPAGPLEPPDANTPARVDFNNTYPVDLFRLFLPALNEIPAAPNPTTPWYLERVMRRIWGLGSAINPSTAGTQTIQYDSIEGAPAYTFGTSGGTFQLRRFIRTYFKTVNCYDLAAIAQLAVTIIQDDTGADIARTKWIYCDSYGYINPGPLIGWPQFPNCNSPFFSEGEPFYPEPPENPGRRQFSNHAWIEVTPDLANPMARTVLDATHCLHAAPNDPAIGTQSRDAYLLAQTDITRGDNIRTYSMFYASLVCANPVTDRYISAYNPDSRLYQIGVTSIGTLPTFFVERREPAAKAKTTAPTLVNNAPLSPEATRTIVDAVFPGASVADSDMLVGSAGCQSLTSINAPDLPEQPLHIEISNFEESADARFIYSEHERTLREIVTHEKLLPIDSLGDESIRSTGNVTFRRNAVLLRIFLSPIPGSDIVALADKVLDIAKLLDSHVDSHAVKPGNEARPSPVLREKPKILTKVGEEFSLHLGELGEAGDVLIAELDDHGVVLPAGPGTGDGKFRLFSVGEGKAKVSLCVAHREKLTVSVTEVEVEVKGTDTVG